MNVDRKLNLLLGTSYKIVERKFYNVNFDLLKQPTLHFITEVRRCHRMRPHIHRDCFSHLFNKDAIFYLPRLDLFFFFFSLFLSLALKFEKKSNPVNFFCFLGTKKKSAKEESHRFEKKFKNKFTY